jgi:phage-related protein
MKKNFIAYKGTKFEIEWYFDDRGRSDVLDYFGNLSIDRQKKLFYLLRHLGDKGKIFNIVKFRNENDQIYAIKPAQDRFLCFFFEGSKIIITNAYEKKTDKIPPREKERALKAKADYIQRCKKEIYYDQKD